MSDNQVSLEHDTRPRFAQSAHRLYTRLGFYEGTFVVGDTGGTVHDSSPRPFQTGQLKCNASAELTEGDLSIRPISGAPLTIEPEQIRGVILNSKGSSSSSSGCERVLNVLWEKDGNYLCTVLVIMYMSKSLPRDWKRTLESLARRTNAPEVPQAIRERVRLGFFDYKTFNAFMRYIFLVALGIQVLVWASILAVRALAP